MMKDINNNHPNFMQTDYNKLLTLYDTIDLYTGYIHCNMVTFETGGMEEVHYFRNQINRQPASLDDLIEINKNLPPDKQWKLIDLGASEYHMQGGINELYNLKFVFADGRFEAVYNKKGELVTATNNMGTYNYAPFNFVGVVDHAMVDVINYLYGNVPNSQNIFDISKGLGNVTKIYEKNKER